MSDVPMPEDLKVFLDGLMANGGMILVSEIFERLGEDPARWEGAMVAFKWMVRLLAETREATYDAEQQLTVLVGLVAFISETPVGTSALRRVK